MPKNIVVVFDKEKWPGARKLVNPDVIPDGAFVNPDLSHLRGTNPIDWYVKDGAITCDDVDELPWSPAQVKEIVVERTVTVEKVVLCTNWVLIALAFALGMAIHALSVMA